MRPDDDVEPLALAELFSHVWAEEVDLLVPPVWVLVDALVHDMIRVARVGPDHIQHEGVGDVLDGPLDALQVLQAPTAIAEPAMQHENPTADLRGKGQPIKGGVHRLVHRRPLCRQPPSYVLLERVAAWQLAHVPELVVSSNEEGVRRVDRLQGEQDGDHLQLMLAPVDEVTVEDVGRRLDVSTAVEGETELLEHHEEVAKLAVDVAEDLRRHGDPHERRLRLELFAARRGEEAQVVGLLLLGGAQHRFKRLSVRHPVPVQAILFSCRVPGYLHCGLQHIVGDLVLLGLSGGCHGSSPASDCTHEGVKLHLLVHSVIGDVGALHPSCSVGDAHLGREAVRARPLQDRGLCSAVQDGARKCMHGLTRA
mmetsp:Transcript_116371/g.336117  ORF Transcript_116371/g.336117 Transcript_116371/m.336117 type:complete len:367 (-) Transcript_116371:852-1952(-)